MAQSHAINVTTTLEDVAGTCPAPPPYVPAGVTAPPSAVGNSTEFSPTSNRTLLSSFFAFRKYLRGSERVNGTTSAESDTPETGTGSAAEHRSYMVRARSAAQTYFHLLKTTAHSHPNTTAAVSFFIAGYLVAAIAKAVASAASPQKDNGTTKQAEIKKSSKISRAKLDNQYEEENKRQLVGAANDALCCTILFLATVGFQQLYAYNFTASPPPRLDLYASIGVTALSAGVVAHHHVQQFLARRAEYQEALECSDNSIAR